MVAKIHARRRRYRPVGNARNRSSRFKTFLKEADAKKYAEAKGLKGYKIQKAKYGLSKKFKIVLE